MKKLLALLAIVALVFCVSGSTCTQFGYQGAKDFICNPSDAQKAEAKQWLAALDAVQIIAAALFPPLALAKASAVMTTIASGGCFMATEVEAALNLLQDTQKKMFTAKGLKAGPAPVAKQYPALWAAVQAAKK